MRGEPEHILGKWQSLGHNSKTKEEIFSSPPGFEPWLVPMQLRASVLPMCNTDLNCSPESTINVFQNQNQSCNSYLDNLVGTEGLSHILSKRFAVNETILCSEKK